MTTSKRPAAPAPSTRAQKPAPRPVTPVKPADEKIGEGPGNLHAREEAFKRRRGGS